MQFLIPVAYAQNAADASKDGVGDSLSLLVNKLPLVGAAVFILALSFLVGKIAKRAAQRAIVRSGRHEAALSFVGKTAYIGCVILGLTVSLKITGVDISFIVGALGFGSGFGLKNVLENYIAGVIILVQEPFRIGDMIQVGVNFGCVEQIEARTTFIRLFDGQRIIIPNSDLVSLPVINFSTFPERRLTIAVGVSYDTDMNQAIKVILEGLKKDRRILEEPPPIVTFNGFGESSLDMHVRFWIDNTVSNWLEMTSVGVRLVKDALTAAGINIPFPIRTLSINPLDSDDVYQIAGKQHTLEQNPHTVPRNSEADGATARLAF